MRLAHFTNTYYPVVNGVVRSVSSFRQALSDKGHIVFVFAQHSDYEDEEPFIFRYPSIDLPVAQSYPLSIPISNRIDWMLPALKLDVIHSHHPFSLGQAAASQAEDLGLPLVFTYHTRYREYSHYISLNKELATQAIDRWMGDYLQRCQHIIAPSQSIKQILEQDYGVTQRVTVVPTGIELEPFEQADPDSVRQARGWGDDLILISVGRLGKEKNWLTLLKAVKLALDGRNGVRLVLVGDGDERKNLQKEAKSLGLGDRVEFTGSVPFEDVPSYLKAADIFCFASVTETQGLVTMEAMAAGLPIVAVDATGTSDEVEHGTHGLLTENDSEALGQAIARLLDEPELREKLATAALQKSNRLTASHQAEKLIEVYAQAIEDKQAERFVSVDEKKKIFSFSFDEDQWDDLLERANKFGKNIQDIINPPKVDKK